MLCNLEKIIDVLEIEDLEDSNGKLKTCSA
jgi:hypothetical protein